MNPTKVQIEEIKSGFTYMQTPEDLVKLLNLAKPIIYGAKSIPFKLKDVSFYCNPKRTQSIYEFSNQYTEFKIKKKSGGHRAIHAPKKGLKAIQRTFTFVLQCIFEPHKAAMGFVKKRSIVDNAKLHINSRYVYNIDLKDFFPSIDQARLWKCLQLQPFNLNKETSRNLEMLKWDDFEIKFPQQSSQLKKKYTQFLKFKDNNDPKNDVSAKSLQGIQIPFLKREKLEAKYVYFDLETNYHRVTPYLLKESRIELANWISAICCTELEVERINEQSGDVELVKRNVLPQGAPTSPVITNIICQRMDLLLTGVAKRFGLLYSRYADDLTFSSLHNVYQKDGEFIKELHRIISEQGFRINSNKTRLQKDGYKKEVTGLLVHNQVNVQKKYIKEIRKWLYYWETYGYEKASIIYSDNYFEKPPLKNVLLGKLDFLKMVKGKENSTFILLKSRFDLLNKSKKVNEIRTDHLNQTLDLLLSDGLDKSMEFYQPRK